jgi:site-specific DNA-methyltransferase (adenine-specific)
MDARSPFVATTGRVVGDALATLRGLGDASVGLIVTDPPWALAGAGRFDACASYPRLSLSEIGDVLDEGRRVLVRGGHLYLFAPAGDLLPDILHEFVTLDLWRFVRMLAWDKDTHRGLGAYRNVWEPVLVLSNGPSRGFAKTCEYPSMMKQRAAVEARTAKPWQLYKTFVEMSSEPGELVLDPFCGTNPLEQAVAHVSPARRWLAVDVFTPEQVAQQVRRREWAKTGGAYSEATVPKVAGSSSLAQFDGGAA